MSESSLDAMGSVRLQHSWETDSSDGSDYINRDDHMHINVLLHTPSCQFTPHALHCIEIMPGVTMVIISEVLSVIFCKFVLVYLCLIRL